MSSDMVLTPDQQAKLKEYTEKNIPHTLQCTITGKYLGEDSTDHQHHYVVVRLEQ